jgi:hypothetical protein
MPDSSSFNSPAPNNAWTDLLQTTQDRLVKLSNIDWRKFASPPDPPGLSLHCHLLWHICYLTSGFSKSWNNCMTRNKYIRSFKLWWMQKLLFLSALPRTILKEM